MPPALAFRHPASHSGTGAFRYRTASPYSLPGAGGPIIVVHSVIGLTGIPTLRRWKGIKPARAIVHVQASGGEKEYTLHGSYMATSRAKLGHLTSRSRCRNARKSLSGIDISPVQSTAPIRSVIWQHSQSDSAGHGLIRHCPSILFSCNQISYFVALGLSKL
jgi:hypothetical protein